MKIAEQCRAITRSGSRCSRKGKVAGFCGNHLPKPKTASLFQNVKRTGEILAVAGSLIALIEKLVHVWQSLPFGVGPSMPDDYEYLSDLLGPSWPDMPDFLVTGNYGKDSVDWRIARSIFDGAHEILASNTTESSAVKKLSELENSTQHLLDTMQPQVRDVLCQKLGQEDDDGA